MTTVACNVFGGMSGYVPVYSNSKGGMLLGHVDNGKTVYKIVGTAEEFGFAQIDKRVVQDAAPDMKVTDTGQYWMEKSHMEEIVTPPPPVGEIKRMQVLRVSKDLQTGETFVEYKDVS